MNINDAVVRALRTVNLEQRQARIAKLSNEDLQYVITKIEGETWMSEEGRRLFLEDLRVEASRRGA